jgi:hypothetical protein
MMGLIADLISVNRKLLERINIRAAHIEHAIGYDSGPGDERPAHIKPSGLDK